jgi:hypothetical protein
MARPKSWAGKWPPLGHALPSLALPSPAEPSHTFSFDRLRGGKPVPQCLALAAARVNQEATPFQPLGNMFGNVAGGPNDAVSAATDYRGIIGSPNGYSRNGILPALGYRALSRTVS